MTKNNTQYSDKNTLRVSCHIYGVSNHVEGLVDEVLLHRSASLTNVLAQLIGQRSEHDPIAVNSGQSADTFSWTFLIFGTEQAVFQVSLGGRLP
jgi:hypothetical protein